MKEFNNMSIVEQHDKLGEELIETTVNFFNGVDNEITAEQLSISAGAYVSGISFIIAAIFNENEKDHEKTLEEIRNFILEIMSKRSRNLKWKNLI